MLGALADAARATAAVAKAAAGEPELSELETPDESETDPELTDLEKSELGEIDRILQSDDGPPLSEAMVYRQKTGGTWASLDTVAPREVSVRRFAEDYGGGTYKVIFRGPGSGKFKGTLVLRGKPKIIEVDPSIPALPPPRFRKAAEPPATAATGPAPGFDFGAELMKINLTLMQAMATMVMKVGQPDPLLAKVLERAIEPRDQLAEAAKLKALLGGGSLKDRLEELELINERLGTGSGARAEPSSRAGRSMWDIADKGLDMFAQLLGGQPRGLGLRAPPERRIAAAPVAPVTPAPASSDTTAPPPPTTTAEPPDVPSMFFSMIASYLPELTKRAQANRRPDLAAGETVEQIPAAFHGQVLAFVSSGGLLERLAEQYPDVANHREWFGEYLEGLVFDLREALGLEQPDEDESLEAGEPQSLIDAARRAARPDAG